MVNSHHRKHLNCARWASQLLSCSDITGYRCWSLGSIRPYGSTLPEHYPGKLYSDTVMTLECVCVCQLSRDWLLLLPTDWRWDLEEKLLLLCLLYGSFFTLNAENLFRGHRILASSCLPELILAALSIDKAFSGAKYAAYVLQLSSLYFPADSQIGLVQPLSAGFFP